MSGEMLRFDNLDLLSVPASSNRAEQGSGEHCSHCLLSWLPLSLSLSLSNWSEHSVGQLKDMLVVHNIDIELLQTACL